VAGLRVAVEVFLMATLTGLASGILARGDAGQQQEEDESYQISLPLN
jgi:hypothetical protein